MFNLMLSGKNIEASAAAPDFRAASQAGRLTTTSSSNLHPCKSKRENVVKDVQQTAEPNHAPSHHFDGAGNLGTSLLSLTTSLGVKPPLSFLLICSLSALRSSSLSGKYFSSSTPAGPPRSSRVLVPAGLLLYCSSASFTHRRLLGLGASLPPRLPLQMRSLLVCLHLFITACRPHFTHHCSTLTPFLFLSCLFLPRTGLHPSPRTFLSGPLGLPSQVLLHLLSCLCRFCLSLLDHL
ncbi:hypothetical protein EYF80_029860 [Liparis tanakae]|uniref:Uncharacterized protein n=1 Tax=Liparis tanakae TaxID=230148 RepID=A0A4Z2H4Z3_9TELE|nr:hypothetical protein EYF80_029860 [Liparis tanakae]